MFSEHPELCVGMLFCEPLRDDEAIFITGETIAYLLRGRKKEAALSEAGVALGLMASLSEES